MITNYIRNRTGNHFGFDDRDPEQVALANRKAHEFSGVPGTTPGGKSISGKANRAVAWKKARGLIADAYVGYDD